MSKVPSPIADALLITLSAAADDEVGPPVLLGKTLLHRQLELGQQLGISRVILLGDDMAASAMALRHLAEKSGIIVQVASGPHALTALLAPQDRLLVLQPDLLIEDAAVFADLPAEGAILTMPAALGREAGFERIDMTRAWAGALIIRGSALSRLLDLPEDCEAAPALLRIGLQAGLAERMLADDCLMQGNWFLFGYGGDTSLVEDKWLVRHGSDTGPPSFSKWLAGKITRRFAGQLLAKAAALPVALGISVLLAVGAAAAGWFAMPVAAFAAIAGAAVMLEAGLVLARLRAAPFGGAGRWRQLRLVIDAMLLLTCILLIDGMWFRQAFGPLVLLAALHLPSLPTSTRWPSFIRDRAMIGAVMAGLAAVMPVEPLIMAVGLLQLGAKLLIGLRERG